MDNEKKEIAVESGHWYDMDGNPAYTTKAKDGTARPTTLRDARKLLLLPSVTMICNVAAKPALEVWKQRQIVLAALTLPAMDGETLDERAVRIVLVVVEQVLLGDAVRGRGQKSPEAPTT